MLFTGPEGTVTHRTPHQGGRRCSRPPRGRHDGHSGRRRSQQGWSSSGGAMSARAGHTTHARRDKGKRSWQATGPGGPDVPHAPPRGMSLGTKLIGLLLLGVLVIMGLDLYLRVHQIEANLLHDLRREVAAVSNTLHLTLTITKTDRPEQYFTSLAQSLSHFEYILGVVFYDREGRVIVRSTTLQDHPLPDVDVQEVLHARWPAAAL
jgi:hypothetical protein